jgi:hypothetical protein
MSDMVWEEDTTWKQNPVKTWAEDGQVGLDYSLRRRRGGKTAPSRIMMTKKIISAVWRHSATKMQPQ